MSAAAHTAALVKPKPEPSHRALLAAYRELRTLHWPDTLEAALEHKHWRTALYRVAPKYDAPARPAPAVQVVHRLPCGPVPPTPVPPRTGNRAINSLAVGTYSPLGTWTKPLPMHGRVDIKRLAANDKDD